uniref:Adaptor related protein complex 5 subunit mu 1 n=1 Tax=Anser brachyrhynchus TaxID=132585 RepID=A0A8B9C5H5_9AVES
MALRALWVLRHDPRAGGAVLFSRRYPTVETRAEAFNGSTHVAIPSDGDFLKALLFELRLTDDQSFVEHRDTCTRIDHSSMRSNRFGDPTHIKANLRLMSVSVKRSSACSMTREMLWTCGKFTEW